MLWTNKAFYMPKKIRLTVPVSVIIPTIHRKELLTETIGRILDCDPAPDEVLVHVDGGDSETAVAVRDQFGEVTVLESARRLGPGGGRSALVATARNKIVASFDDDSYPIDRGYFSRLVKAATAHPEAAVIAASIHHRGERPDPSLERRAEVSDFIGCGCAFRKDAFARIGGFVPLPLAYGVEENDFALRVHAAGHRIIMDHSLRVFHDTTLAHQAHREITSASIRNLALLAYLRYPPSLWWLGLAQVTNRVFWLLRNRRYSGVIYGLTSIPAHLWRYRAWRATVPAHAVNSWTKARRAEAAQVGAHMADAE